MEQRNGGISLRSEFPGSRDPKCKERGGVGHWPIISSWSIVGDPSVAQAAPAVLRQTPRIESATRDEESVARPKS